MPNPNASADSKTMKLSDCYPYRRLFEEFAGLVDGEGVLDYSSDMSRLMLDDLNDELRDLGFNQDQITTSAGIALGDLHILRAHVDYMEDPGDLFAQA